MDEHDADHEDAGIDELDHVPQPNGRLTLATVATVRDRLLRNDLLFRLDDEGIARHFTQAFFSGNAWKVSLGQLREVLANLDSCPKDIPSDPAKFPRWVRTELLEFEHLPREKLAELYQWASEDLQAIEANIRDCTEAIATIKKRSPTTDSDPSDERFYRHYVKRNEAAKDEIVKVLTHSMKREALRASYGEPFLSFFPHVPWSFRWNPDGFKPACFSPIRHMFLDLPVRTLRDVERLHEAGDKSQFDGFLETYIHKKNPVGKIRDLLGEHHLLAVRRDVIKPALEAYERGELALFASAAATQIEGIIEDGCQLSGISLETLRVASIITKLEVLVDDGSVRIDYVYYAFRFPILRNRIAHGRQLVGDLRQTTQCLILDLYDCCRIVQEHPGPQNAIIKFLRNPGLDLPTVADMVEFAAIFAQVDGAPPDAFYGLSETFDRFKMLLDKQSVWDFMDRLLLASRDELDSGLRFIADHMKNRRPALRHSCTRLLGSLDRRGRDKFDRKEFMAAVRQQDGHDTPALDASELRALLLGVLQARR